MTTPRPSPHNRNERGIALVTAVLFVMLTAVIAGTFMATTVHERAATSSVVVAKGSLYAAESGVRTVQQQLANVAKTKLDSLITVYKNAGNTGALIKQPTKTFPAGTMTLASTNPKFDAVYSIDYSDSLMGDEGQEFNYRYRVVATGTFSAQGKRTVESTGLIKLSAGKGTFADYLMFTDVHTSTSGGAVWFTSNTKFDGRIHTNGKFRFQAKPTFGDLATSQGSTAYFYNSGKTKELNASSNAPNDVPVFNGGFQRGVGNVALPTNTFFQETAALGLTPSTTYDPSNADVNTACATGAGTGTPPSGVYLPNTSGAVKGGIYCQGNLTSARLSIDGSGNQVYTLKQSGSNTYTITVNRTANTTSYKKNSNPTLTYTGVPNGSLFCVGSISDFGGPTRTGSSAIAGIADKSQILVTATSDIVIQSDILTKDFTNGKAVVGVYSHGGNVRIGSSAPNNVQIDAFLMALGTSSVVCVDNHDSGSSRGEAILRGGLISKYYGAFGTFSGSGASTTPKSGYMRNFKYDGRGIPPPFFPTTPSLIANIPSARTLSWAER